MSLAKQYESVHTNAFPETSFTSELIVVHFLLRPSRRIYYSHVRCQRIASRPGHLMVASWILAAYCSQSKTALTYQLPSLSYVYVHFSEVYSFYGTPQPPSFGERRSSGAKAVLSTPVLIAFGPPGNEATHEHKLRTKPTKQICPIQWCSSRVFIVWLYI